MTAAPTETDLLVGSLYPGVRSESASGAFVGKAPGRPATLNCAGPFAIVQGLNDGLPESKTMTNGGPALYLFGEKEVSK